MFLGFRSLFCYKDLVNVLNSEMDNINIQEARVLKTTVAERADGKTLEDHLLKW